MVVDRILLAPDDGGQAGGGGTSIDSGGSISDTSGISGGGESLGTGGMGVAPAPFFEIEDSKGKKYSFKDAEDLKQQFSRFGMLQSDYSRKTAEHARTVEEFAGQRKKTEESWERINKMNKFLGENPHVYRQLQQAMQRGTTGDVAVEKARAMMQEGNKELMGQIEELRKWKEKQEFSERRNSIYENMKRRYADFDPQHIQQMMDGIDPNDMESIVDLLYHANRGEMTPEQRARMADAQRMKQQSRMVSNSGGGAVPIKSAKSLDEAYEMAMREVGS